MRIFLLSVVFFISQISLADSISQSSPIDIRSLGGNFLVSEGDCIKALNIYSSESDTIVLDYGFAKNLLYQVNKGWHQSGYPIESSAVTNELFDGKTLTVKDRGVLEGYKTTKWTFDDHIQRLVENGYSYGRLTYTCSYRRNN